MASGWASKMEYGLACLISALEWALILEEAKVGVGSGGWRWVRRMALGKGGHVLRTP